MSTFGQPHADEAGDLAGRTRSVVARLGRRLRQTKAGHDLTPSQYEVLVTVVRRGPLRLSELATVEGLNPTMLSRMAAKLEAAGLVTRSQDPSDGRVAHIACTEAGSALFEQIRDERAAALGVVLDQLSETDRRDLAKALPVLEHLADMLKDRQP